MGWSVSIQHDRGKRHELRTAAALGLTRTGNTGRATADAASRWVVCECKSRAALPRWLLHGVEQAKASAGPSQLPVLVLHQVGQRSGRDLVVLTRAAFVEWFGALHPEGEVEQE
jgi:hypothetical protein